MTTRVDLITTPDQLADHAATWRKAPWLALDTEFLREETYHSKLCLIQVSDGQNDVCIDTLAIGDVGLEPLWPLLAEPAQTAVFHAASQDLEIFARLMAGPVASLFDTQIAAALLGHGDQLGYASLVEKRTGITLDKSLTRTDWSRRPLNAAELAYAAADVSHLAAIHGEMEAELAARGRLGWLREDCARLADPARYRNPPEQAWRRLKGLPRLAAEAQPVAMALADWRERVAQQRDRPRRWILDDDALYRLAERRPRSRAELSALNLLPPKTLERNTDALLEVIAAASQSGSSGPAGYGSAAQEELLTDAQKADVKRLQEALRGIADAQGLPLSLLAPRAELEALARYGADASVTVLTGWRRAVAGEALLKLLG